MQCTIIEVLLLPRAIERLILEAPNHREALRSLALMGRGGPCLTCRRSLASNQPMSTVLHGHIRTKLPGGVCFVVRKNIRATLPDFSSFPELRSPESSLCATCAKALSEIVQVEEDRKKVRSNPRYRVPPKQQRALRRDSRSRLTKQMHIRRKELPPSNNEGEENQHDDNGDVRSEQAPPKNDRNAPPPTDDDSGNEKQHANDGENDDEETATIHDDRWNEQINEQENEDGGQEHAHHPITHFNCALCRFLKSGAGPGGLGKNEVRPMHRLRELVVKRVGDKESAFLGVANFLWSSRRELAEGINVCHPVEFAKELLNSTANDSSVLCLAHYSACIRAANAKSPLVLTCSFCRKKLICGAKGRKIKVMVEKVENDDSKYLAICSALNAIMNDVQPESNGGTRSVDDDMDQIIDEAICCNSCYMTVWKCANGYVKPRLGSSVPDGHIDGQSLYNREEEKQSIHQPLLIEYLTSAENSLQSMEDNNPVQWSRQMFAQYRGAAEHQNIQPVSFRTFNRAVSTHTDIVSISTAMKEKGSAMMLFPSLKKCLTAASLNREKYGEMSTREENELLKKLSDTYKGHNSNSRRILAASCPIVECIRLICGVDFRLLRAAIMRTESRQQYVNRLAAEALAFPSHEVFDLRKIPFPYGTKDISRDTVQDMSKSDHRLLVKALFRIEQSARARSSGGEGPISNVMGKLLHIESKKSVVETCSKLGICLSYNVLQRRRALLYRRNASQKISEKIDPGIQCIWIWDNVDKETRKNIQHIVGESKNMHGTLVCGAQTSGNTPLICEEPYSKLTLREFGRPRDLLRSPRVSDCGATTRSCNILVCGLVWFFRENLMSSDPRCAVSLTHLLQRALRDKWPAVDGRPVVTAPIMLNISKQMSNSDEKALDVMRMCIDATKEACGDNPFRYYGPVIADNPLFLRMCKIVHDAPPGKRNAEFDRVVIGMGYFHASMALFHTSKLLCFDGFLDEMAKDSGLTTGAQSILRSLKDPKTNIRFFLQCISALIPRLTEVLVNSESSDLVLPEFAPTEAGAAARPLEELYSELLSHGSGTFPTGFNLSVETSLFTSKVAAMGEAIVVGMEKAISDITEPNTRFVCQSLLELMIPPVMFHFMGRHGCGREQNDLFTTMVPAIYQTTKTNYQLAALYDLVEKCTMPDLVFRSLFDKATGSCASVSGTRGAKLEFDEFQETEAVLKAKSGSRQGGPESVMESFYTTSEQLADVPALKDMISSAPRAAGNSDDGEAQKPRFENERRGTVNVRLMFLRISGRRGNERALLDEAHRDTPALMNVLSSDSLSLSGKMTDELLNYKERGIHAFEQHATSLLYPWRDWTRPFRGWTRKYAVGGFASERDKLKKNASDAKKKSLNHRKNLAANVLRERGKDLAEAERKGMQELSGIIRKNIDLVSTKPLAMMEPGTDMPRHATKSDTIKETQNALLDYFVSGPSTASCPPFLLHCHPPGFAGKVFVAVDGMNGVHSKLNHAFSLTIGMHVDKVAQRMLSQAFSVSGPATAAVEFNFDDPEFVPQAKLNECQKRDRARARSSNAAGTESSDEQTFVFSLNSAPPKDWDYYVLGNRDAKRRFVNSVAGSVLIHAGKMSISKRFAHGTPIRIHGALVAFSPVVSARSVSSDDLRLASAENGCAIIYHVCEELSCIAEQSLQSASATICCGLQTRAQIGGYHASICPLVLSKFTRWDSMASTVGEGEVRMQAVLSKAFSEDMKSSGNTSNSSVTILQVSDDSDNVVLALAAMCRGMFGDADVFVKLRYTYADIRKLYAALTFGILSHETQRLQVEAWIHLTCLCGNDFNNGYEVATPRHLVRTYFANRSQFGYLKTLEHVLRLFYSAFVAPKSSLRLPELSGELFSSSWREDARMEIAFSQRTKSGSQLLPQEPDFEHVFRRAILWNWGAYWSKLDDLNLGVVPCGVEFGFNNGLPILVTDADASARRQLLKLLRPPKCFCGKTGNGPCCTTNSRCSCVKRSGMCGPKCGCPEARCANREELERPIEGVSENGSTSASPSNSRPGTSSDSEQVKTFALIVSSPGEDDSEATNEN